jgi:hypothetical protein
MKKQYFISPRSGSHNPVGEQVTPFHPKKGGCLREVCMPFDILSTGSLFSARQRKGKLSNQESNTIHTESQ